MTDRISRTQSILSSPVSVSSKAAIISSTPIVSLLALLARTTACSITSVSRVWAIWHKMASVFSVNLMVPSGEVSFKHFLTADRKWPPTMAPDPRFFFCFLDCESVGSMDFIGVLPAFLAFDGLLDIGGAIFFFIYSQRREIMNKPTGTKRITIQIETEMAAEHKLMFYNSIPVYI